MREAFFYRPRHETYRYSIGDINGIGPEVALKAVAKYSWPGDVRFTLIGREAVAREQAAAMRIPVSRRFDFLDVDAGAKWAPGKVRVDASRLADGAIRRLRPRRHQGAARGARPPLLPGAARKA